VRGEGGKREERMCGGRRGMGGGSNADWGVEGAAEKGYRQCRIMPRDRRRDAGHGRSETGQSELCCFLEIVLRRMKISEAVYYLPGGEKMSSMPSSLVGTPARESNATQSCGTAATRPDGR